MARAGKAAAIAFTVVYGIILFYVAFQAFWLIKQRHRKTSFKMGFNVLTMLWSLLRILDWVSSYDDNFNPAGFWYSLVHYFPQAVQFATFGLLAVFWAKVIYRSKWRSTYKLPIRSLYCLLSAGMMATTLVGSGSKNQKGIAKLQQVFSGTIFFILAIAFAWITYHVLRMQPREYSRMFMLSPRVVAGVVLMLFAVFVTRAAFDVAAVAGAVNVNTGGSATLEDTLIFLVAYLWWEICPIAALLATVATGSVGQRAASTATPSYGVFGAIASMQGGEGGGNEGLVPTDGSDSDEAGIDDNPLVDQLLGGSGGAGQGGANAQAAPGTISYRNSSHSTGYEIPEGAVPPHISALARQEQGKYQAFVSPSTLGTQQGAHGGTSATSGPGTFRDAYDAYLAQQGGGNSHGVSDIGSARAGIYVGSAHGAALLEAAGFPANDGSFQTHSLQRQNHGSSGEELSSSSSTHSAAMHGGGIGLHGAGYASSANSASSAGRSLVEHSTDGEFHNERRYDSPADGHMHHMENSYNARHGNMHNAFG